MTLLIFDCDGVLVESEAILITAELEFLGRHGVVFERSDYVRTYMGMAPREWKERLSRSLSAKLGREVSAEFFDELDDFTTARLQDQLVSVDGARSVIEGFSHQRCVASSSSPDGLVWKLSHTQLLDLFDENLFSTHLVEKGKPEPDLFLHAAHTMGFEPAECIVIEDSVNGVVAAKRAGMKAIGFTAASHCLEGHDITLSKGGADMVAGSYRELKEIVGNF
ncbi:MAG: HAD-IA family hydrolase [Pseudomonadales bacterium]|nr:HAD-IA family hydrolase [Pseudomonadales bacterium]